MANAKRCDICGEYYLVPERGDLLYDDMINTNMVRVLRLKKDTAAPKHDIMQFDACDDCLQDVLDFILTQRASWEHSRNKQSL